MPSFEKASNVAAEQAQLQAFLDELLTLYLRDVLSFVNTNYDLFIRHLRALGHDDPQADAKEVFHALRAVAGVPVPEHGPETPVRYDLGPLEVVALDESNKEFENRKFVWTEEDDPFASGENVPAAVEKSWRAYQLSRRSIDGNHSAALPQKFVTPRDKGKVERAFKLPTGTKRALSRREKK